MQINNKITVVIVTYQTNRSILLKCLSSINKNIEILIVENSKKFEDKNLFLKKFKNLQIICSGKNLGYGRGNNYGLTKIKTKYALILNPDTQLKSNFFENLKKVFKNIENFHLIGCAHNNNKKILSAGYFDVQKNKEFKKVINTKKINFLTKVEWIRGFSIIVNLKKFKKKEIFDKNYFLYFEEIDLCKSIKKESGNIYFAKNLKVNHLGFKGSIGASKSKINHAENLRNWHYMWSSFYFYKKNYSYLIALKKMSGKFVRSGLKTFFYMLTFQTIKKNKYLFRFLGILTSLIGMKSFYRIKKFN